MKKILTILIVCICLILSFSNFVFADYINPKNVVVFNDGSFAYMQVSSINITTQNGVVIARSDAKSVPELHETTVETTETTTTTQTELGDIDIVFVLDVSSSMQSKMEALKNATKNLIKKIYTIYEGNEEKIKIGIIKYSSKNKEEIIFNLSTSDMSTLNAKINSLVSNGTTYVSQALKMADEMLSQDTETENKHIIIINDGDAFDKADTQAALADISEKNINLSTVLIAISTSNVFGSPSNPIPSKNKVFSTTNSEDDIYDKIFNEIGSIIEDTIENNTDTTTETDYSVYIESKTTKNISEVDNLYLVTLPNDIIYGSVIEFQYDFIINSKHKLDTIIIEDYFKNCEYSSSCSTLQGSLNNSDYQWNLGTNKKFVKSKITNMENYLEDDSNGYVYKFKLVLKSLLSEQNDTMFENMAKISMTNVLGNTYSADPFTDEHSLASYKISICPPTGQKAINIPLFIFTVILLNLFGILVRKIKHN